MGRRWPPSRPRIPLSFTGLSTSPVIFMRYVPTPSGALIPSNIAACRPGASTRPSHVLLYEPGEAYIVPLSTPSKKRQKASSFQPPLSDTSILIVPVDSLVTVYKTWSPVQFVQVLPSSPLTRACTKYLPSSSCWGTRAHRDRGVDGGNTSASIPPIRT